MNDLISKKDISTKLKEIFLEMLIDTSSYFDNDIEEEVYDMSRFNTILELNKKVQTIIKNAPLARKKGEWLRQDYWTEEYGINPQDGYYWGCSECGTKIKGGYARNINNFCPNCGAAMWRNKNE